MFEAVLSGGASITIIAKRCNMQFVMEVDEMLFEAFAPQRLKGVLENGKMIKLKPLRRFFGLDIPPVLKLVATSVMIGLMAGLSIVPQTQYLLAAGDAMCGTCVD
jgi:hypothetical protein